MRFPKAAKGVTKIFIAELLFLLAILASLAVVIIDAVTGALRNIDLSNIVGTADTTILVSMGIAAFLFLVGGLLTVIGYFQAAKDEEYFVKAIIYAIISFILFGAAGVLQMQNGEVIYWITAGVYALAELMRLLVATSTVNGLIELSADCRRRDLVDRGSTIIKLLATIYTLSIIAVVLIPVIKLFINESITNIITLVIGVIIAVLSLIKYILYLGYLGKASSMLKEA